MRKERLLEHYLRPLSVFDIGVSACSTAIHSAKPPGFPANCANAARPGCLFTMVSLCHNAVGAVSVIKMGRALMPR
ncbi:hypothetical protein BCU00_019690 [Vibrio breoganii]|uniref:hypothetical protein n=1 Tax=Vibrio breoganii TaxID=553239 RepID=UPI0039A77270